MISERIRQRFLQDPLPTRLGNLTSDLARIASWSDCSGNGEVVASVLEESKYFCEWAASGAPLETQIMLADLQCAIVRWERGWLKGSPVPTMRIDAERKSNELLELAGLV